MLKKILHVLPLVIITTVLNTIITSCVSGLVLLQLASSGYGYWSLVASILTAIIIYCWLIFNHKIRFYIKSFEGDVNE